MVKEICLNKLRTAIACADSFQKHIIQEGVKKLLFKELTMDGRVGVNWLLYQFLEDCDIFKDDKTPEDEVESHIDAAAELKKDMEDEFESPYNISCVDWLPEGYIDNDYFFGTKRDWYDTSLTPKIDSLIWEPYTEYKKVYNTIIAHPKNIWILEQLPYFNADLYSVQNVPNKTDFLAVGRYGNKCNIIVSCTKGDPNCFFLYEGNLGQNTSVDKIEFSDFYSTIRLVDNEQGEFYKDELRMKKKIKNTLD